MEVYCVLFASGQGFSGVYVGVAAEYMDVLVEVAEVVDGLKDVVSVLRIDLHIINGYLVLEPTLLLSSLLTGHEPCCTWFSRIFLPPTAPPTAALITSKAITAATRQNVRTFMPKMIRGG